jgi:hypothetical protein
MPNWTGRHEFWPSGLAPLVIEIQNSEHQNAAVAGSLARVLLGIGDRWRQHVGSVQQGQEEVRSSCILERNIKFRTSPV